MEKFLSAVSSLIKVLASRDKSLAAADKFKSRNWRKSSNICAQRLIKSLWINSTASRREARTEMPPRASARAIRSRYDWGTEAWRGWEA